VITGDVFLGGNITEEYEKSPFDVAERVFGRIRGYLRNADLVFGNLEGSIAPGPSRIEDGPPARIVLANPAWALDVLRRVGINVVSLSNNHTMDHGEIGLRSTLSRAKDVIETVGAGANLDEACQPAEFEIKGRRVAFLAFSQTGVLHEERAASREKPGIAPLDADLVLGAVSDAVARNDVVVMYFHHGLNRELLPEPSLRKLARKCIDLGATCVVGSHTHQITTKETVSGRPVYYGLGDLCFPETIGPGLHIRPFPKSKHSLLLSISIDDRGVRWREYPVVFDPRRQIVIPVGSARGFFAGLPQRFFSGLIRSSHSDREFEKKFESWSMREPGTRRAGVLRGIIEFPAIATHVFWSIFDPPTCRPFLGPGYRPLPAVERVTTRLRKWRRRNPPTTDGKCS
jgi:hypothetical protein